MNAVSRSTVSLLVIFVGAIGACTANKPSRQPTIERTASVDVHVLDQAGTPLPGARTWLCPGAHVSVSDTHGVARFRGLTGGRYAVWVDLPGLRQRLPRPEAFASAADLSTSVVTVLEIDFNRGDVVITSRPEEVPTPTPTAVVVCPSTA